MSFLLFAADAVASSEDEDDDESSSEENKLSSSQKLLRKSHVYSLCWTERFVNVVPPTVVCFSDDFSSS